MSKLLDSEEVLLKGMRKINGGLFNKTEILSQEACLTKEGVINILQLYHKRMCQQNKRHVEKVINRELNIKSSLDGELCEGCVKVKTDRLKFGKRRRAEKPCKLIHTGVCGPLVYSKSGFRYSLIFKGDYSKFSEVYFIKYKSKISYKLKEFLTEVKSSGAKVKIILTNNGGEFDNNQVRKNATQGSIAL